MSWVRVWVHFVFTTKNRQRILKPHKLRKEIFKHIKANANKKGILLDTINGFEEHVHCLISLSKEVSISKTMQMVKGESSFWFNRKENIREKLFWQDDYWAVSVSESHLEKVRNYINTQEEHHRRKSFREEVEGFMGKYGWGYYK